MNACEPVRRNRVAVSSAIDTRSLEWEQRRLIALHLESIGLEASLIDPPDAIVLRPATSDERHQAVAWQLHDLLDIPLILIVEGESHDQRVALFERGADDVLSEPVDPCLLAACVAAVLRRSRRDSERGLPGVLQLDAVEVDMARRVVHRAGRTQRLSRTEYNLLVALLRANGRACTHRELITQVWGTNSSAAGHYLRLYIRYLREKLEEDPRRPRRIVNVWGTGYRLIRSHHAAADLSGSHAAVSTSTMARDAIPPSMEVAWTPHSLSSPPLSPAVVMSMPSVSPAIP